MALWCVPIKTKTISYSEVVVEAEDAAAASEAAEHDHNWIRLPADKGKAVCTTKAVGAPVRMPD